MTAQPGVVAEVDQTADHDAAVTLAGMDLDTLAEEDEPVGHHVRVP